MAGVECDPTPMRRRRTEVFGTYSKALEPQRHARWGLRACLLICLFAVVVCLFVVAVVSVVVCVGVEAASPLQCRLGCAADKIELRVLIAPKLLGSVSRDREQLALGRC